MKRELFALLVITLAILKLSGSVRKGKEKKTLGLHSVCPSIYTQGTYNICLYLTFSVFPHP